LGGLEEHRTVPNDQEKALSSARMLQRMQKKDDAIHNNLAD